MDKEKNVFQQQEQQKKLESLSNEIGMDVPVDTIKLPSKGLIYSPDHPMYMTETVDIKCMSAKEEDILTSTALIKNGTVITKLLQSCLINKLIDPDQLLIGDRNAILIAVRVSGYGTSYDVEIECPECQEKFENSFNLGRLEIKDLGATPVQDGMNLFSYTLPISGVEVLFKLLTGKDEYDISQEQSRKKKITKTQIESGVTSRLFRSVMSIGGEKDRNKLARMVNNMVAGDARALRNYISSIEPGVNMKQFVECQYCGEQTEVDIPLGISFLYPDIK